MTPDDRVHDEELHRSTRDKTGACSGANADAQPAVTFPLDGARYRAIVEEQSELICRFLPDGTITFANEADCRHFGKTREEMIGTSIYALMTEENIERQKKFMATLTVENPVGVIETGGVMLDGSVRWRRWAERAIYDNQGRLVEFQAVGHEITDRKLAEEALRHSEEKLRAIVNTAVDGIITINTEGIIESFNPAAVRMFGYEEHEAIGENVRVLMAEPFRSEHDGYIARYVATGEKRLIGVGREVVARHKNGSEFPVEIAASAARLGERWIFTGNVRDITERKRIEERVRRHETELAHFSRLTTMGEMAAGIAHELNQPLSAIMNFAEACTQRLQRGAVEPSAILETMQKVSAMADRAGDIIRGLRALAHRRVACRSRVDLSQLVRETVGMAAGEARLSGVTVAVELGGENFTAYVEPVQIQQVILNLIRNALDALETVEGNSCTLVISARRCAPDTVEIAVTDSGPGLAPELADRLFEPFVTTKAHGLGMGLSISKSIIDAHGGRLWVEPNPDRGVTVRFTLPSNPE